MNKSTMTFRDLTAEWVKSITPVQCPKTIDDINRDLRFLTEDIGDMKLTDLTVDFLSGYFQKLETRTFEAGYSIGKKNVRAVLGRKGLNRKKLLEEMKIAKSTLSYVFNGTKVAKKWALNFSEKVGIPYEALFDDYGEQRKYSIGTVQKTKSVVRQALAYAQSKGYVEDNYARIHYIHSPKVEHKKAEIPTDDEITAVFDTALKYPDIRVRAAVMLLFVFDFNRLEVNSLDWTSFNFNNNTISSTDRTILVSPKIMAIISDYRKWQQENEPYDNNFIFRQSDGRKIHDGTTKSWFRKVLARANLTQYTLKDFQEAKFDISKLQIGDIPEIRTVGREQYYNSPMRKEMHRLGFKTYNEYLDYLEFLSALEEFKAQKNNEME